SIAHNDNATTYENIPVSFTVAQLLANDIDPTGAGLNVTSAGNPTNGALAFDANTQTYTFTPDQDYIGPASFDYTVTDSNGATATATVNIRVGDYNLLPEPSSDSVSVLEDNTIILSIADLLANDFDADGHTLTI